MHSNYKEVKIPLPALPRVQEGFFLFPSVEEKNLFRPIPSLVHLILWGQDPPGREELVGSERLNPTLCHGLTPTHLGTGLDPCSRDREVWKHGGFTRGNCPGAAEGGSQGCSSRAGAGQGVALAPWRGTEDEMEQLSLARGVLHWQSSGNGGGNDKNPAAAQQ